jgi:hypothetical protein
LRDQLRAYTESVAGVEQRGDLLVDLAANQDQIEEAEAPVRVTFVIAPKQAVFGL